MSMNLRVIATSQLAAATPGPGTGAAVARAPRLVSRKRHLRARKPRYPEAYVFPLAFRKAEQRLPWAAPAKIQPATVSGPRCSHQLLGCKSINGPPPVPCAAAAECTIRFCPFNSLRLRQFHQ